MHYFADGKDGKLEPDRCVSDEGKVIECSEMHGFGGNEDDSTRVSCLLFYHA